MAKGIYKHKKGEKSNHYTHGKSHSRLYRIWANMKTRCYNTSSNKRTEWQEKGIIICDEWKNSFEVFYDWAMANGYSDNLTIDRIDNNGNYEPNNCRWTTYHEQNINKSCVPKYEYNGILFNQCDVFELFGIKRTTFAMRLCKGWNIKDAIEIPVGGDKYRTRKKL